MIDSRYDENLLENLFFQDLKLICRDLIQCATRDNWIICVPKADSFQRSNLSEEDFLTHVLIPNDELPKTHYRTLNGKQVTVSNRVITIENDDVASSKSTHVIFEEIFYTDNLERYKVWCVECLLNHNTFQIEACNSVTTLRDCIDLLGTESLGKEVLENLDAAVEKFLNRNDDLEQCSLQTQKDLVSVLYAKCLQISLRGRLRERTARNQHLLNNIKVSVESYMLHGIHKKLFASISVCTAFEDSAFNKIIRNLSELQLRDLNIKADFFDSVLCAKRELAKINGYSTVLGKLNCLRNTLNDISKASDKLVGTDDLLPIFVFLVLKTNIANWIANLVYLKQFQFSSQTAADDSGFLVATLEAAIEHVRSGVLLGPVEPEGQGLEADSGVDALVKVQDDNVKYLFEQIRSGSYEEVFRILQKSKVQNPKSDTELCHPLCSCDKCERLLSQDKCNSTLTVYSCDDRGFTALHIACMYGKPKIVELLLEHNANVESRDYSGATPLHYAAMRGYQNALLLLLHSGANVNATDSERNTALHFCCNNGHDSCVKALLYFSEHKINGIDVNCCNALGNTPLHYASRWGYDSIVQILLEYGAKSDLENKHRKTALDCAHNLNIYRTIKSAKHQEDAWEQIDSKSLDFVNEPKIKSKTIKTLKKIELLLRAVAYGDLRLTQFYLNLDSKRNQTQCHPLCACDKCQSSSKDQTESIDQDINVCNSEGFTALHVASLHGRTEIVQLLLENGASPNIVTRKGLSPLHLACQSQRFEIIKLLLTSKDCNVNLQDARGNSSLHYACYVHDKRIMQLLLEYGADPKLKNINGRTAQTETDLKINS